MPNLGPQPGRCLQNGKLFYITALQPVIPETNAKRLLLTGNPAAWLSGVIGSESACSGRFSGMIRSCSVEWQAPCREGIFQAQKSWGVETTPLKQDSPNPGLQLYPGFETQPPSTLSSSNSAVLLFPAMLYTLPMVSQPCSTLWAFSSAQTAFWDTGHNCPECPCAQHGCVTIQQN